MSFPSLGICKQGRITSDTQAALKKKLTSGATMAPIAVLFGNVTPRKSGTVVVPIEERRCYRFAVVAKKSGVEMSLALFQGSNEVARDRLSGTRPSVVWCATEPGAITAEVAMFRGSGAFGLALFAETEKGTSRGFKIGGDGNDFIANRIRQIHRQFGDETVPISKVLKGKLSQGASQSFEISINGGCVSVIGVGGPGVENLDVVLVENGGKPLARDSRDSSFPVLKTPTCRQKTGIHEIQVLMKRGSGHFGLQIFSDQ